VAAPLAPIEGFTAGQHPQHDPACRRYVKECRGFIRRLRAKMEGAA
jgi:hypothetical protein